jgi:hypothetical protein
MPAEPPKNVISGIVHVGLGVKTVVKGPRTLRGTAIIEAKRVGELSAGG